MPDTTKPYHYIEMEINRLKYAARAARDKMRLLDNEADIYDVSSHELELTLRKQIEVDNTKKA